MTNLLGLLLANLLISLPSWANQARTVFYPTSESQPEFGHFIELNSKGYTRILRVEDHVNWVLCEGHHKIRKTSLSVTYTRCKQASADLQEKVTVIGEWKQVPGQFRQVFAVPTGTKAIFKKSLLIDRPVDGTPANLTQHEGSKEIHLVATLFGIQGNLDKARQVVRKVIETFQAENPQIEVPQKQNPSPIPQPTDEYHTLPKPITEQDI